MDSDPGYGAGSFRRHRGAGLLREGARAREYRILARRRHRERAMDRSNPIPGDCRSRFGWRLHFAGPDHGAFPWDLHASFVSEAPHLDLAPPTFTILEVVRRRVADGTIARCCAPSAERPMSAILFPSGFGRGSRAFGRAAVASLSRRNSQHFNGWMMYACPATPASGVEISFSVPLGKPVEVSAADENYGLPPEGAFLLNSRPADGHALAEWRCHHRHPPRATASVVMCADGVPVKVSPWFFAEPPSAPINSI